MNVVVKTFVKDEGLKGEIIHNGEKSFTANTSTKSKTYRTFAGAYTFLVNRGYKMVRDS